MSFSKRWLTRVVVFSVMVWSIGITALLPQKVYAATVVATGPFDLLPASGMMAPASSFDMPVLRFALKHAADDSGNTLSSVTVTVTSTVPTNNATLATHISQLVVFRDSNNNGSFDPQNDGLAGTQSTVNVGVATTITVSANNSIAANDALPTSFFVAIKTAAGWAAGDSIYVNMAANGIVSSNSSSPTVTALTGTRAISFGGGGGWSGFSISSVTYVNATTVDVTFSDLLDLNSGVATSTGNYSFSGAGASAVTSVTVLSDNKSVRVSAAGATLVSTGTSLITVTADVKSNMGMPNANTSATVIYSGVKPLVISEIQAGTALDEFNEFVEIYNRSGGAVPTSSLKLHIINATGATDTNVTLTWRNNGAGIPSRGFLLLAPAYSSVAASADAVYTTSTALSIVPNGALYISNSVASSTAVLDKVCWGTHSTTADCEGPAASALTNNGLSIERKALNDSTASIMAVGGTHAAQGNGIDTQNNNFDFVTRAVPLPQSTASTIETPNLGSWGGANNQAPSIQAAPIFTASASSTFNLVARISDDGGALPAANTQLIFCTDNANTCAPASSTPIYGVSIGAGWYKFTPTSTPWNNLKSYFRYYLQATDSASPVKSKVFTNDPSFDSVTYSTSGAGIQTSALQQSKAISANVSQGNLGSAVISGTVNNSSGAGVGDATVWIDGTQFAATTGNDGTFSFSNVGPAGGITVKVAKDGYVDQSISTYLPSTGLVSLGTLTLNSGNMGQGGDYTMPSVKSSFPTSGMMGFPTRSSTDGVSTMDITFSKVMDTTTIVDTDASDSGSNVYLTVAGSADKIAGAVAMISGSTTQARFTPSAALTAGTGYTLFITSAVKDSVGNPISGKGPGGSYVLMFSTASGMFSTPGAVTSFGTGNSFPPYVVGSQPAPGKVNVTLNSKAFVTFSEALQNSETNLAKVKLYKVTNANTASESKTEVSGVTNSLDVSNKILILTPGSNLDQSSTYRVEVLGGLSSAKGIPMGNPGTAGYATDIMYKSAFQTGTGTDSTAPTIAGTIPADSATGVSTIKPIVISFSEAINPSTITDTSVSLKLGSTAVSGNLTYDSNSRTATFVSAYALTASSTYTINVTTDVADLSGQALNTALLRNFTTGSANTSNPNVVSAQASDFSMKVVYSQPMLSVTASDSNYAYSVLNKDNYTVKRVSGTTGATLATITLTSAATLSYDSASRSVAISNVSGLASGDFANIAVSNVKDIGFNTLATGGNAATTTAQSSAKTGGFTSGMGTGPMMDSSGNIMQGGMMGGPPPMVGTFRDSGIGFAPGVKVYPFNKMAGVSTIYGVEVPISYQVPNAGFVDITFPDGTDVSNAKKDTNSPPNSDLNGPGPGTVVFGTAEGTLPNGFTTGGQSADGVIVNATTRVVRVILGSVATRRGAANLTSGDGDQHDFLRLDIAQVVNSTISTAIDSSGSTATVETKKADGTTLETLSSTAFFTNAAGSFTLRGHATTTSSGINGINVFLMSPMSGPMSSSSANGRYGATDGEFMFQNLVAGTYMLGADQFAKSGATTYTAGFPKSVTVSATTCPSNICTADVSLTDASTGVAVTLSISGTFSNTAIDIFAGGPGSYRKATSTLNGTLTADTSNTIKLNTNGVWMVGFGPQMSNEMFGKGGPAAPTTWMPPKPQEVLVSGCPNSCSVSPSTLTFNISKADNTIKFVVRDASSNAIANAHVSAYSPLGGMGIDSNANADGTGSLSMATGTYKIAAGVAGMPQGIERSITVKNNYVYIDGSATGVALSTMASTDLVLLISKPSYTISGKVTDGTNAVANAPVNAYRTDGPGHAETFTNSSGEYTLYVSNGTWKVQAFVPDYGKLQEKSVIISGSSASSQNFEPDTSSINYATVNVSVGNDTDADGIIDSGEGASNVQMIVEGTTGDLSNDGDTSDSGENVAYINTSLTDTNGSSTLKLPPGSFTLRAWSPIQGEMASSTQSIVVNGSGTVTAAPYDIVVPATVTVIINILDSNGSATSTSKAVVEFMQIGGKADKVLSFSNVASSTLLLPKYDVTAALNAVTSTNPVNIYLMNVTIPGISQADLLVYGADSNTILATSTAANGYWKVEVDGNESINIKMPAIRYVSGTVKDTAGVAVPDATVHLENKSTGETIDLQADTSGNFSTKVSSGNYLIKASKDGYLSTASSVTISSDGALSSSLTTLTAVSKTITGTITAGGSVSSGATVRAKKLGGGAVTATTESDGTYTLNVVAGNWKVSASAEGYTMETYSSVVTVGTSNITGINLTLSTTKTSLAGSASQTVTPQTGGSLNNSSSGTSIKAAESALADSANAYSVNEKETSNVVGGGSGSPIGGEAKSITSYDSDSELVSLLKKDVGVGISYTMGELTISLGSVTLAKLRKIKMASWDSTADDWRHLPTTIGYKDSLGKFVEPSIDASSVTYTGQTGSFSVFNPISPEDGLDPSAPFAVNATAGNAQIALSWSAPTTNDDADATALSDLLGYELYRSTNASSGFVQVNTSNITGTSYTDTGLSNGVVYYYKVTAADTGGLESDFSPVVSATPVSSGGSSGGGGASVSVNTSPTLGAIPVALSGGAVSNSVLSRKITLALNAANTTQVMVSENSNFIGATWSTYGSSLLFTLSSGDGVKTLYAKFRSAYGIESGVQTLSLTLKEKAGASTPSVTTPTAGQPTGTVSTPSSVSTPAEGTAVVSAEAVANAESAVAISNINALSFQPGNSIKYSYQYENDSGKNLSIRIVRQILNSRGKSVKSLSAVRLVKTGKTFEADVKDIINRSWPAGEYAVKVKISNAKTGKLLDENSFKIQVEKLKKKSFVYASGAETEGALAFDGASLAKLPATKVLPATLKIKYGYTNLTEAKQTLRMTRYVSGVGGKKTEVRSGKWMMIPAEKDTLTFNLPVTASYGVGEYSLCVEASDWKTKEVLHKACLPFGVELR